MDNRFKISMRLSSTTYDFIELREQTYKYPYRYYQMGESVLKNDINNSFKAKANVLLFSNIYITNNIDGDCGGGIALLEPLIKN